MIDFNVHELLDDAFDDDLRPMDCLTAWGRLKDPLRRREDYLVRQCRAEGATWEQIGIALQRDETLVELLYGERGR